MYRWEVVTADGACYAKLFICDDYIGKWVYDEGAFHYYLSDTHSYGYPKPLPAGVEPPPPLGPDAPAGNVGDGSFYGRDPGVETVPIDKGSDEMSDVPDPIPPVKPGWTTSEFWLALVAQAIPILVLLHVIPTGDAETLMGQINAVIQGVFAVIVPAVALWKYISSRATVKAAHFQALRG